MNHQNHHYFHHPTYHHVATGYHAPYAYPMLLSSHPSASHPPALLKGSVPLPDVRLAPLQVDDEQPLPPVPFVVESRELDRHLKWGTWRQLPKPCGPHPSNRLGSVNELLSPATSPGKRELIMVVNVAGQAEREVLVRPQGGASVVSVLDVINAVEAELWRAERRRPAEGAYHYIGRSVCRERGGSWKWCGLAEAKDENDVWVLHL